MGRYFAKSYFISNNGNFWVLQTDLKQGLVPLFEAYPTLNDVPSDWDDEKKENLKPKEQELNRKEMMIALGAKHQESVRYQCSYNPGDLRRNLNKPPTGLRWTLKVVKAYPTMDDVVSDWESTKDNDGKKKNGLDKKLNGSDAEEVDFELQLLDSGNKPNTSLKSLKSRGRRVRSEKKI
ncbi:unnamed protein product [Strongylus vulgaris]|uniref:Uncharacterized protein n=1 Tax=Strongylus vulgaris TaxID=40348 RepID=A0A3P7J2L8_STRVU|nr:unnamed protein product [Strongylus vulgaris]